MRVWRVYIDTSVIGGLFDEEFMEDTHRFLSLAREGSYRLLFSYLLLDELRNAPDRIRNILDELSPEIYEMVAASQEAEVLSQKYLEAGVLTPKSADDALHVALATVARADVIVSWNFKHIVNFSRIHGYNAVNLLHGYHTLEIHSPTEMLSDENENL